MQSERKYDVVICGGGLAGLTLARQLKLELPALSVAIVDRVPRPLQEAAHKVGESSIELASYYFGNVLQLEDYLLNNHLLKLGLRFFFGNPQGPFEDRPELGPSVYPPIPSYQIDRGRFENDLRQMAIDMGVELFEGTIVDDVMLANGPEPHRVLCRQRAPLREYTLWGRWLIDALGRRRFLQSKLDLMLPSEHLASAAWWRIKTRLSVQDMGVNGGRRWKGRIVEDRAMSTNHLMGRGYWVWLIPLASGATSVGIVTDETIHPLHTYGKSYSHALAWLLEHEPAAWRLMNTCEPLDFHSIKNYSYHSRQIFSHRRWTCVGEAAIFLDPLYSLGSDFIAITNTITVEMVRRNLVDELTEGEVYEFNRLVLDFLAPHGLAYYKDTYRTFGHAHIFTAKLAWDTAMYWAIIAQMFIQNIIRCPTPEVLTLLRKYNELNQCVQSLFIDWAEAAPPRAPFIHADLTRMRLLQLLHLDLAVHRNMEDFLQIAKLNLDRLEELAQILFWQAVEECHPAHMPQERGSLPWINAWRITLVPNRWKADGLYDPFTASRPLRSMRGTLAGVFGPKTWLEQVQVELPYQLRHLLGGKPASALIGFLHNRLVRDKPAMWLRRLFVTDYPSILED